jgi:hypothetical protein
VYYRVHSTQCSTLTLRRTPGRVTAGTQAQCRQAVRRPGVSPADAHVQWTYSVLQARTCSVLQARTCSGPQTRTCSGLQARTCSGLQARTCSGLQARTCSGLQARPREYVCVCARVGCVVCVYRCTAGSRAECRAGRVRRPGTNNVPGALTWYKLCTRPGSNYVPDLVQTMYQVHRPGTNYVPDLVQTMYQTWYKQCTRCTRPGCKQCTRCADLVRGIRFATLDASSQRTPAGRPAACA